LKTPNIIPYSHAKGTSNPFVTIHSIISLFILWWRAVIPLPCWRTPPYWLSVTTYSVYSRLPPTCGGSLFHSNRRARLAVVTRDIHPLYTEQKQTLGYMSVHLHVEMLDSRLSQRWFWTVLPSTIQRLVVCWKSTYVSSEHVASIFRVEARNQLDRVNSNRRDVSHFPSVSHINPRFPKAHYFVSHLLLLVYFYSWGILRPWRCRR
jgi:hypothetical protein